MLVENFVIGRGQIGEPIRTMLNCDGWDITDGTAPPVARPLVLHICFPYSDHFPQYVTDYIYRVQPRNVVVHSTVLPGTTRTIQRRLLQTDAPSSCGVAYSPVRGRHGQMIRDMQYFTKHVAGTTPEGANAAMGALAAAGFKVKLHPDPTALELAKIFQTTATAVQIALAQEMARYCADLGVDFMDAQALMDMPNLPDVTHLPGYIGGHCLMPNLEFLDKITGAGGLTAWLRYSNKMREAHHGREKERVYPIPLRQQV